MTEHLPLYGRVIIEHVQPDISPVSRRAIAVAGRIAADLGATVVRYLDGFQTFDDWSRANAFALASYDNVVPPEHLTSIARFLDCGKVVRTAGETSCDGSGFLELAARADAVLSAGGELAKPLATAPIRVLVGHGVPAHFGIADQHVTDTVILALSGLLDLMGHPDRPPVPFGGEQASGVAGLAAFSGLVAALAAGKPDTVQVSALEACLWSNWKSYAERLYLSRTPTRMGALSEWQAVKCADGYTALVYLEKDWPAVCRLIGDPRLASPPLDTQIGRRANMAAIYDIVRPWYASRTRSEITRLARAEGLPIAPVLSVEEVLADPQYLALNFFAPAVSGPRLSEGRVPTIPSVWNGRRFAPQSEPSGERLRSALADSGTRTIEPRAMPLAGVRVLDLGIITAGASTSALLADLGADVVKLESPSYIDPFRVWDRGLGAPDWWNRSRFFDFTNRSKRGLALDLKSKEGRELFLDLVEHVDVVVENFRRGVLERLGLGWDVLIARNPRLILASITSQGESGPDAGAASYGSTLEANSGLSDLTRDHNDEPLISGILLNYPDQIVAIYAAGIVTLAVMQQRASGRGARLDISQRELASFLIGDHILAASSGAPMPPSPPVHFTKGTSGRWSLRTPNGGSIPVRNGDDIFNAVQSGEIRFAFAKTPDARDAKGVPFTLDNSPFSISSPAPWLGQHNEEVLRTMLGLDGARIDALTKAGVIGTTPKA